MTVHEVVSVIEAIAPLSYQEHYDNSGLIIGKREDTITGILITLDVTEEVIDEAISLNANLIISHHPVIFNAIKKLTGETYIERILIKAIRNNLILYAAHTNLDNVITGINSTLSDKLGLINKKILVQKKNELLKLVTYVSLEHADKVRQALFEAGAGHIGNYDSCSYTSEGNGTFKANKEADPYIGEIGKLHIEKEIRIETILPRIVKNKVVKALLDNHPYEEPAYDIYSLENSYPLIGSGMIGELSDPKEENDFLAFIKKIFQLKCIRHTRLPGKPVKKVAICSGSGSFLLPDAISSGADAFISSDFKYHQFFDADNKLIIIDMGHYESERYTKDIFYGLLIKKFPTFAVHLSKVNTNPINYL